MSSGSKWLSDLTNLKANLIGRIVDLSSGVQFMLQGKGLKR